MKRSRTITLAFMAGAALTLTACGEDPDTADMGELYRDRQACMAQNSMAECDRTGFVR